jgi:hypothetical protein
MQNFHVPRLRYIGSSNDITWKKFSWYAAEEKHNPALMRHAGGDDAIKKMMVIIFSDDT